VNVSGYDRIAKAVWGHEGNSFNNHEVWMGGGDYDS